MCLVLTSEAALSPLEAKDVVVKNTEQEAGRASAFSKSSYEVAVRS